MLDTPVFLEISNGAEKARLIKGRVEGSPSVQFSLSRNPSCNPAEVKEANATVMASHRLRVIR